VLIGQQALGVRVDQDGVKERRRDVPVEQPIPVLRERRRPSTAADEHQQINHIPNQSTAVHRVHPRTVQMGRPDNATRILSARRERIVSFAAFAG